MKIVVCVKQVAVLGDEVEFTPDGRDVDPDYLESTLNEWDTYATEEAVLLREALGEGEVVAVTVGPDEADKALRRALALGADRGIRVQPEGALLGDPLAVARLLAPVVREEGPDLVLAGVQSSDAVQGATGTALAALLALPCVSVVKQLEYDAGARTATVHRELEGGLVQVVETAIPAVLTIQTGINEPHYVTMRALRQADQKEIAVVEPAGPPARSASVRRMYPPPRVEGAQMLDGGPGELAGRIKQLVEEALG